MPWYVYIIRCRDHSLYTGVTNDLQRRINAHNAGDGGRYTRSRGPVTLIHSEEHPTRSAAQKREAGIKGLTRKEKLQLCK